MNKSGALQKAPLLLSKKVLPFRDRKNILTTARRGGQLSVETIERICLGLGITLKDFFDASYL